MLPVEVAAANILVHGWQALNRLLAVEPSSPHKERYEFQQGLDVASLGLSAAERETIENFKRDVIEPSMTALVVLDFWAAWCGPCKALAPVLEKVAAEYAPRVQLVKINVDENRLIASQFRVQSIPTVYAIFQGRPVADLTPARTERELRHYLDQILKQLPIPDSVAEEQQDLATLIAMGEQVLAEGDPARALSIFDQLLDMAPEDMAVRAGRARALVALGRIDEAEAALAALTDEQNRDTGVSRARAAIALAREAQPVDNLEALRAQVAQNPDALEARFALAGGYMAIGDRDAAADHLLEIIRRDRTWQEGTARDRLLKLFEAVGLEDSWVLATRRKLSAILFS